MIQDKRQPGSESSRDLPEHVEQTVRSITEFKVEHARSATGPERAVERVTNALGRPQFIAFLAIFVSVWVLANVYPGAFHLRRFDDPPFYWLQGLISFTALCMTTLILTTQRRLDRLADERAQLTLQVAIVAEQKTTKLIQLLEEFRLDHPQLPNRDDPVAEAMSASADPQTVLEAIREGNEEQLTEL